MATTTSINDENEEVNNSWQQSATQTSRHRAVPPTPQDTAIQNDVEAASRSQTNRPSVSTIEGEINNPNFNRNGERFNRDLLLQRNRLYVYNKLDNAQFGAFHFKMLFITGLGFFTVITFLLLTNFARFNLIFILNLLSNLIPVLQDMYDLFSM